jgi:hypothetical protein
MFHFFVPVAGGNVSVELLVESEDLWSFHGENAFLLNFN